MDFFEAVAKRYSYRGTFRQEPVKDVDLRKILEAGIKAPSGYNGQTTDFIVVKNKEMIHKIAEILAIQEIETAPVVIVAVTEQIKFGDLCFEVEDYAAAVQTIQLAITALGYASVWNDGDLKENGSFEKVAQLLGVPQGKTVRCALPVGIPTEQGSQAERKSFEERVTIVS